MAYRWVILLCAGLLESAFGYPAWLYARIRHPVAWMGTGIAALESRFNRLHLTAAARRCLGAVSLAVLLLLVLAAALLIQKVGYGLEILAMASLLAGRSLYDHVREVASALEQRDIVAAREKVGRIVGRDVAALDEAGVCRAAIESLAESFCDGVVAPVFWAMFLGLPGIACYKAINTADSMIGHKDERYRAYGWAAARTDDRVNMIPARLSALLIVMVAGSRSAWRAVRRDAKNHASPNAGWPEAAMAGALGLLLGGPRSYEGVEYPAAFIGDGTCAATPEHLRRALRLYVQASLLLWVMIGLAWPALATGR